MGYIKDWIFYLRLRYSPYWRGYRDGLNARDRAHQKYLRLQQHIDPPEHPGG